MDDKTLLDYFDKWHVKPYEKLKELPGGDGGFVAFMIGLALYERLLRARLKKSGIDSENENEFKKLMQEDLSLSRVEANDFWELFRHGIMHQAMPQIKSTKRIGWYFKHEFSSRPKLKVFSGAKVFCINPWKFTQRVIDAFLKEPSLLGMSPRNPFGQSW